MPKASFGSISSGTMRADDLIPAFAAELAYLDKDDNAFADLIREADETEDYDSEDAADILEELFEALNEFAPTYGYFGAHPGEGADYGFWLHEDWQQNMRDDDVLEVSDLADIPEDYAGEVLIVNDHGNATFGHVEAGKFSETWSVV